MGGLHVVLDEDDVADVGGVTKRRRELVFGNHKQPPLFSNQVYHKRMILPNGLGERRPSVAIHGVDVRAAVQNDACATGEEEIRRRYLRVQST